MAEAFNRRGETAIILNYDLCSDVNIGVIVAQIQKAVIWLFGEQAPCSLNTSNIQISGHSAGGHLIAAMLTTNWRSLGLTPFPFEQATSLSGLFDLQPLIPTTINTALGLNEKQAKQWSQIGKTPLLQQSVGLKLIVGELESDSYKQQSNALAEHWAKYRLDIESVIATSLNHFSLLQHYLEHNYIPLT